MEALTQTDNIINHFHRFSERIKALKNVYSPDVLYIIADDSTLPDTLY